MKIKYNTSRTPKKSHRRDIKQKQKQYCEPREFPEMENDYLDYWRYRIESVVYSSCNKRLYIRYCTVCTRYTSPWYRLLSSSRVCYFCYFQLTDLPTDPTTRTATPFPRARGPARSNLVHFSISRINSCFLMPSFYQTDKLTTLHLGQYMVDSWDRSVPCAVNVSFITTIDHIL